MKRRWGWVLLLGMIAWLAADGFARPQVRDQKILRHDAAAVIKLIPIRVLGPDGKPVTGLRKEDFVLTDNGESKTITEFEVHAVPSAPAYAVAALATDRALSPAPAPIRDLGRKFILFIDVQSADPNGLANAKDAADRFIDTQMRPGDQAAVLAYRALSGFVLLEYLTSDPEKIRKAIHRADELPPRNDLFMEGRGIDDTNEVDPDTPAGAWGMGVPVVSFGGIGGMARTAADFRGDIVEIAKALQTIPGAKSVVFFSARDVGADIGREFASVNIPVFTVNTKNWIIVGVMSGVKKKHIYTEHPLKEMAEASGGRYFADIEAVDTIAAEIQMLTGFYYVLGYYITENWDGRFHKVQVEVRRAGARVYAQEGYFGSKPFDQFTEIEKKLHLFDLAFSEHPSAIGSVEVTAEAFFAHDGRSYNAVLLVRLPVDEKTGVPARKTEVQAFFFDRDHRIVHSVSGTIDLARHDQKTLYPYAPARLAPGDYVCRFVARDPATGQSAFATAPLKIPEPASAQIAFFSPLLLDSRGDPRFIHVAGPAQKGAPRSTILDFYPLLPRGCCPLVKTLPADTRRLVAVWTAQFKGEKAPDFELRFTLTPAGGGAPIELDGRAVEAKNYAPGRAAMVLEIALPDVAVGAYTLVITAIEVETQAAHSAAVFFEKR